MYTTKDPEYLEAVREIQQTIITKGIASAIGVTDDTEAYIVGHHSEKTLQNVTNEQLETHWINAGQTAKEIWPWIDQVKVLHGAVIVIPNTPAIREWAQQFAQAVNAGNYDDACLYHMLIQKRRNDLRDLAAYVDDETLTLKRQHVRSR